MRKWFYLVAGVLLLAATVMLGEFIPARAYTAPALLIKPGRGSFSFNGQVVYYDAPAGDLASSRVLIVMHGQSRAARSYRGAWAAEAERAHALLLVPEFADAAYPGDAYTLGPDSFKVIEPLYDAVRDDTGNRIGGYYLYGHSAGAQFVHRFLLLVPANRAKRTIAANAGWYTAPEDQPWPYGLRGAPAGIDVQRWLEKPMTILLGEQDTDTTDPDLRHTAGADRQGPHRLARGKFFYATGVARARQLGSPISWTLKTAPGVAHSNADMVPAAAHVFFP